MSFPFMHGSFCCPGSYTNGFARGNMIGFRRGASIGYRQGTYDGYGQGYGDGYMQGSFNTALFGPFGPLIAGMGLFNGGGCCGGGNPFKNLIAGGLGMAAGAAVSQLIYKC